MPIGVQNFTPNTFEQANPFLSGFSAAQQPLSTMLAQHLLNLQGQTEAAKLPYVAPKESQSLQKAIYENMMAKPKAALAPQFANAELEQARAVPGLTRAESKSALAQALLHSVNANILQQETPSLVQQQKENVYKDPILNRAYQLSLAQKTGDIPQNTLSMLGFGNNGQPQAGNSSGTSGASSSGLTNMFGANNQSTPLGAPKLFSGTPEQNWQITGSPYSLAQQQQIAAQGEGLKEGAKEQSKQDIDNWTKDLTESAQASKESINLDNYIDQFNQGYNNTHLTGGIGGLSPQWLSSNATIADQATQNMQATLLKLFPKPTNNELKFLGGLKLNRQMPPEAVKELSDLLKAKNARVRLEQEIKSNLKESGADINTTRKLVNEFNEANPVYNFKTKSVNATPEFSEWLQNRNSKTSSKSQSNELTYNPKTGRLE